MTKSSAGDLAKTQRTRQNSNENAEKSTNPISPVHLERSESEDGLEGTGEGGLLRLGKPRFQPQPRRGTRSQLKYRKQPHAK